MSAEWKSVEARNDQGGDIRPGKLWRDRHNDRTALRRDQPMHEGPWQQKEPLVPIGFGVTITDPGQHVPFRMDCTG